MGGCRCTFRDCENRSSTNNALHFFRYPTKDPERLSLWLKNALQPDFANLTQDKLSNRVVCQVHFERKMFMNRLKDRLTRMAIPRLMPLPEGDQQLNVETGEIVGPDVEDGLFTKPEIITTNPFKQQEKRPSLELAVSTSKDQLDATPIPALKKIKILNPEVFTLKQYDSSRAILRNRGQPPASASTNKPLKPSLVLIPPSKCTPDSASSEQRLTCPPKPASVTHCLVKEEIIIEDEQDCSPLAAEQDVFIDDDEFDRDGDNDDDDNADILISTSEDATTQTIPITTDPMPTDPAVAKALEKNTQELANLRQTIEMLANRPAPQPTTIVAQQTPVPPMRMEKGPQLNKAQLFNGIKRYLNPTMVTLLRMELFGGSADRQWKSDEKTLAIDLLSIGANVYDHFAQEFRFRLPPVSDVEQWKLAGEIDADDAC